MIYLVEDSDEIRELVVYSLEKTGTPACGFSCSDELYPALKKERPELILLDVMLPGENGFSILKRLREDAATSRIPIIMLTARDSEFDKVSALDAGADDYITKPFGVMELIARVKAVLRRTGGENTAKESIPDHTASGLSVFTSSRRVFIDGKEAALTYKEFELLKLLFENRGNVVCRDTILNKVWGYGFDGENRTVDVHIRTLRQKLEPYSNIIETIRGVGYRLN